MYLQKILSHCRYQFSKSSLRLTKIALTLTPFNNIYVISFKKFHEETVDQT